MNIRTELAAGQLAVFLLVLVFLAPGLAQAADKLIGIHSARVMSQSFPWIAEEAGFFRHRYRCSVGRRRGYDVDRGRRQCARLRTRLH
jgi:hypothetical protein